MAEPVVTTSEDEVQQQTIDIGWSYPLSDEYEYEARLRRLNLDKLKLDFIYKGEGFVVSEAQSIKKDLKDPNGIFSPKFGQGLSDLNPYIDKYSCECGRLKSAINNGQKCSNCGTRVRYVGDDYEMTGFMQLKDYHIIHPNLYSAIEYFLGTAGGQNDKDNRHINTKLYNIINYDGEVDQDGKEVIRSPEDLPNDQPFYGIGMIDFYNRFDEIMEYYHQKYPKKESYYIDIMNNRDKIFIQSIPVITTHLRPFEIKNDIHNQTMYFEPLNAMYNLMNNLVTKINRNTTTIDKKKKPKNALLFGLQKEYQRLYDEIIAICSGKKGQLRQLTGGQQNQALCYRNVA